MPSDRLCHGMAETGPHLPTNLTETVSDSGEEADGVQRVTGTANDQLQTILDVL